MNYKLILLLIFIFIRCGMEITPVNNELEFKTLVKVLINASDTINTVKVNKIEEYNYKKYSTLFEMWGESIKGALVQINRDTFKYCEEYGESYYKLKSTSFYPGQSCSLLVICNDDTVLGKTIIPAKPRNIRLNKNEKIIEWDNSETTYLYEVDINEYQFNPADSNWVLNDFYGDYTFLPEFPISESSSNTIRKIEISITAYDKNYWEWIDLHNPKAGIIGGYGYFGSAVTVDTCFIFK